MTELYTDRLKALLVNCLLSNKGGIAMIITKHVNLKTRVKINIIILLLL